ncbi:aerobic cobaltochelatase subunit CobN [Sporomusaceae bacterium FL31]|nr:Aerobic cobaltochelatase subunit CobN [Sporomusaceae bacterium FL31]GCE34062.1 aerobic cobaltochelatase subunit CobN [Sporomusaceae bacterium]
MKLVVMSVSNAGLADLVHVSRAIEEAFPGRLRLSLFYAAKPLNEEEEQRILAATLAADCIILDLMGTTPDYEQLIIKACRMAKGYIVPIGGDNEEIRSLLRLGALTSQELVGMRRPSNPPAAMPGVNMAGKMEAMANAMKAAIDPAKMTDMQHFMQIMQYWKNAEEENIRSLIYLLGRHYSRIAEFPEPQPPIVVEETSIFDPGTAKYYANVAEYRQASSYDPAKPTVAILFYGHSYPNRTRGCVAAFMAKLKPFANVLPVAFARSTTRDLAKLRELLYEQTDKQLDLVVNFLAFRLGAGPMGGDAEAAVRLLAELAVPVLHPFFMSRRETEEWQASTQGINTAEFLIQIMLPELDGCIETIPVGALASASHIADLQVDIQELQLIDERADKVAARIEKWLNLQRKPNHTKKIAIICYNYPPGEDHVFGGAFLDTFVSVERVLGKLAEEGYQTTPVTADELKTVFGAGGLVNSGRWQADTADVPFIRYDSALYQQRLNSPVWQAELNGQWGTPPGEIMSEQRSLLIPGKIFDQVFVGLQPSRGLHEQPEKFYHDKTLLPHHQYIAFYQWLREEFKADAIIHVGTHGTLEFLQGKECGMSGNCLPDYLVQDIPHIYLYYAGNPAEAMIAKRRSHAVLVSYQSPAFTESELYGGLVELEGLLHQHEEAARLDHSRLTAIEQAIAEKAAEQNLTYENLDELEHELYRLRRSLIPHGLHVFGQGFNQLEATAFMKFILRYERGEISALQRVIARDQGMDYDLLLEKNNVPVLTQLDQAAASLVEAYVLERSVPESSLRQAASVTECQAVLEFGYTAYTASRDCQEEQGLINVLAGNYQPAKLAGDMIRNPAILPSGFNLYQFDPRLVPSAVAMATGAKIAENTIVNYVRDHGCYPKNTAVILWGLETSRTQGETLGQILYYLGIKTVAKRGQFSARYAIIPAEELGRPRIDVVINICGFFRDMFPMLIEELNDLFQQIAGLDESPAINYLKANTAVLYQKLLDEGQEPSAARELSQARIFGPAQAEYGTKVSKLIELKNWTDEQEIGATYLNSLQHVYSKNYRGKPAAGLLNAQLATVDVVSQIRSNHEYEVIDLDHYYEYFGGLAKSVEIAKGKKADVYITDTTGEKVQTETVDRSIARGVRTRLLNPKWIDGMLEHAYHGAQKINDRFENILGLAASTNSVDNWIFTGMHATYVADEQMRQRLTDNNRWAYFSMLERLLECNQRGYWQASREELELLQQVWLELEGTIEEDI